MSPWKVIMISYQVDLRNDEATIAALKARGQTPITQEQGKRLAEELKYVLSHNYWQSTATRFIWDSS